jgi:hypothetical protein
MVQLLLTAVHSGAGVIYSLRQSVSQISHVLDAYIRNIGIVHMDVA